VIWRVIKRVAARAGVEAHVHSLRAAFACFYLEANPGDTYGLKELLGHRSFETTQVYLRKLDKGVAMERVRTLSWIDAEAGTATGVAAHHVDESSFVVGAGGFEPPYADPGDERTGGHQHPLNRLLTDRLREVSGREKARPE
jgi:hypothetical protein